VHVVVALVVVALVVAAAAAAALPFLHPSYGQPLFEHPPACTSQWWRFLGHFFSEQQKRAAKACCRPGGESRSKVVLEGRITLLPS